MGQPNWQSYAQATYTALSFFNKGPKVESLQHLPLQLSISLGLASAHSLNLVLCGDGGIELILEVRCDGTGHGPA